MNGYRDERDNIVQRRPTIRTENDNFILETPWMRNITLSPGQGGYVKIGNTIIDPDLPYQVRTRTLFTGLLDLSFVISASLSVFQFDFTLCSCMWWSLDHTSVDYQYVYFFLCSSCCTQKLTVTPLCKHPDFHLSSSARMLFSLTSRHVKSYVARHSQRHSSPPTTARQDGLTEHYLAT